MNSFVEFPATLFPIDRIQNMTIVIYKSALCPRCYLAERYLRELTTPHPEVSIETIDIATAFSRFRRDGIRMIPALRIGDKTLTMVFPTRKDIRQFLQENQLL